MRIGRNEKHNRGGLLMRNRMVFIIVVASLGLLFVNPKSNSVVGTAVREIVEEVFEFVIKKGGREFAESVGEKVGKEAMEELAERTIREAGEEEAKKLFRELGEQALKHGDDAFIVARKYGVSHTVNLLKELPEEIRKKAIHSLLNRGDELMPLVRRFGSEVLEVEARHPGLSVRVASELGEEGLKAVKNCRTDQVIQLLRRKDIWNGLTNEGKKELCRKLDKPGIASQIMDIFEKHPKTTDALSKLGMVLGGIYIVSDKLLSSDIKKQLPDGRVVTDEVSVLQNRTIKQNPDGSIEEVTRGVFDNLAEGMKKIVAEGGGFYFFVIMGTGVGLFFVLRGMAPLLKMNGNKH